MPGAGASPWWSFGLVGGLTTWFQEGTVSGGDTTAAVHEFAHNLGYDHEMRQLCPVGKFTGCAGDLNFPSTGTSTGPTSPGSSKSSSNSATHNASPSAHTSSKPSASPHSSPRLSNSGDGGNELGVTRSPSHTASASESPTSAAAAGKAPLAHTGANILFPALIATGVIGLGTLFLLRARRLKNRRH